MGDRDGHLPEVLGGYAKFLQDKNLALDAAWRCAVDANYSLLYDRQHIYFRITGKWPAPAIDCAISGCPRVPFVEID
jgi:hypothetical protein